MYYIMMISLSMEIIPQGKAGLFDGIVSLGAAIGAFLGPFIATLTSLNYIPTFLITAVLFLAGFCSTENFTIKRKIKKLRERWCARLTVYSVWTLYKSTSSRMLGVSSRKSLTERSMSFDLCYVSAYDEDVCAFVECFFGCFWNDSACDCD